LHALSKVALFLEESGLPYELVPVDTRNGFRSGTSVSRGGSNQFDRRRITV
jgi:glutathione S-transferase